MERCVPGRCEMPSGAHGKTQAGSGCGTREGDSCRRNVILQPKTTLECCVRQSHSCDETFWREEVVEPCMMVIARIANTAEVVEGDAKVNAASSSAAGARDPGPVPAKMTQNPEKPPARPRNTNRAGRVHQIHEGKCTCNRTGYALCAAFNEERCEPSQGLWCRQAWDAARQCQRCLGGHPVTKCPRSELQTPNFAKSAGKGKGRGKSGRGGKGKRPQYWNGERACVEAPVAGAGAKTSDAGASKNSNKTPANPGDRIKTLYLYSGPRRPDDGLADCMEKLGAECVCVDKEFNNDHDLLDQSFWESCATSFEEYDSYTASPPCSAFTPARRPDGGPRPLRGTTGPQRYGLPDLSIGEKKKVTEGTVMALRAADAAWYAHTNGRWRIVEQPHERENKTSMWKLDEFEKLRAREDVYTYTFDQCRFGCKAQKSTDLMSNIPVAWMSSRFVAIMKLSGGWFRGVVKLWNHHTHHCEADNGQSWRSSGMSRCFAILNLLEATSQDHVLHIRDNWTKR